MKTPSPADFMLIALVVLAAFLGFNFSSDPYRLADIGNPVDQEALIHRDSMCSRTSPG